MIEAAPGRRAAVVHGNAGGAGCGVVTVNWPRALTQARRLLAAGATLDDIPAAVRKLA